MTAHKLGRRAFLKSLGAVAVSAAAGAAAAGRSWEKPNIVFIITDDLGYADLGCYGSQAIDTPNIDRMAAEGMRFTDAYSGCTVCAPARSCLMTGYHMGHTSVRLNTGGVPLLDEDVTVAEVLKSAGYVCGGFGKWGLGDVGTSGVPERHGFDIFFGYYHQVHAHNYYPEYLWCNSEKVPLPENAGGKRKQYSHYLIFEQTLKFIRENKERPFFCYAPWTPPHGHYEIPEEDPAWEKYKDEPWPKEAKVVAAMVSMIDRQVGQLLGLLRELGIAQKTIVFFTSDNGAARRFEGTLNSCGPLRGMKRDLYEGGIRVPMIAWWPGMIQPGAVSDFPWYFPDVRPTLTELAGMSWTTPLDGISIVPTLLGEEVAGHEQQQRKFMYWEWARYNWAKRQLVPGGVAQAVRMGRWKAVRPRSGAPLELYDLSSDLGEKHNIAGEHPEIVAQIERYLATCRSNPRPQSEPPKPRGKRFM